MSDAGTPHTYQSAFLRELHWRGLIAQVTDPAGLDAHLLEAEHAGNPADRRAYIGFDPTADSLTIGNLVPIMLLGFFQRAGHTPIVLAGGGTGLIGDPSGKSAERELRTREQVASNVESQKRIFGRVLSFDSGANAATIVNNLDWLGELSYLDALRDIGKHFSVNMMIQKDSVRERLNSREQGISYTEFSYMILQAYDFAHLHRHLGVTLQMGATDQWGNIVAGADLIRRFASQPPHNPQQSASFGLTTPLLTKSDGTKYGKTASGAVWLTAGEGRTSPYAFYQFLLNIPDEDVERFLKTFTFHPREKIEAILVQHKTDPGARVAQRELARTVTDMLHGEPERLRAEKAAAALFSGDVADLPHDLLTEAFAAAPSSDEPRARLDGEGEDLLELLARTLCKSKSEARQALADQSISINGVKARPGERLTPRHLLHGSVILLRRGKRNWFVTRWS
ncbi:MAG: tyrosine--tRNA ligase [Phycisphaerales bacterium]